MSWSYASNRVVPSSFSGASLIKTSETLKWSIPSFHLIKKLKPNESENIRKGKSSGSTGYYIMAIIEDLKTSMFKIKGQEAATSKLSFINSSKASKFREQTFVWEGIEWWGFPN